MWWNFCPYWAHFPGYHNRSFACKPTKFQYLCGSFLFYIYIILVICMVKFKILQNLSGLAVSWSFCVIEVILMGIFVILVHFSCRFLFFKHDIKYVRNLIISLIMLSLLSPRYDNTHRENEGRDNFWLSYVMIFHLRNEERRWPSG